MRRSLQGAALLAAMAATMVGTAQADASTPSLKSLAKAVKKLQHDNKVLSSRIKTQAAALNGLVGCMSVVNLTQYGAADGTFGYMYDENPFDPTVVPFATTGIDATQAGDTGTGFLIVGSDCGSTGRAARAFGLSTFPMATIANSAR
jgi:hypothetical protein